MLRPRFTLVRELGHGGEGRVVAVCDAARAGAIVALKETHGPSGQALAREFELLATLRHRHLAEVYEYFPTSPLGGARAAYTQMFVSGVDLYRTLRAEPALADALVGQLLMALAQLHAAGLVHLDLKPDNVLVEPGPRARLVDFGIAARIGSRLDSVRGSRSYVAPEVLAGEPVAPTADLFALGIAFAEIGLGDPAAARVVAALPLDERQARLEAVLAAPLARLTAELMALDPKQRPASASAAAHLWGSLRNRSLELVTPATAAGLVRSGGLIGREVERSRLLDAIGERRHVSVAGPPGAGRTALMESALREVERRGWTAEAWPLVSGTASIDGFTDALARVVAFAPSEQVALTAAEDTTTPERWAASLRAMAQREVARLATLAPTNAVLFVRHPELAPEPVRAFIEAARDVANLPLALVVATDGEGDISLGPVGVDAIKAFVASRFGVGVAADRALVSALASASGGLPGHLEALLELLVARGELTLEEGGWRFVGDATRLALSPRLADAIASRVALLEGDPHAALIAIATLAPRGQSVAESIIAAALGRDVGPTLDDLVAAGLVRRDADGPVALGHDELGRVLPTLVLDAGARARVLACEALAEVVRARIEGGVIGATRALKAAREALAGLRLEAARSASDLALDLAGSVHAVAFDALSLQAEIADRLGPREAQLAALHALIALLHEDDPRRLAAEGRLFWTLTRMGDPSFEARGESLVTRALNAGQTLLAAEVAVHLAIVASQRGEQDRAERLLIAAREGLTTSPETLALRARISNNLGNVYAYRGDFLRAQGAYREARRLKLDEGDPVGERIALGNMALMSLELGEPAQALDDLALSLALARRTGHRRGEAWSLLTLAEVGLEGASPRYARRRAEAAATLAATLGDQLVESDARTTLAEALLELGEIDAALVEAGRGAELAKAAQNAWTAARARALGLLAAQRQGDTDCEAALAALVDDQSADQTTRNMVARSCAEVALARGEVALAARFVEAFAAESPRGGVRWAELVHTRSRVLRANGRAVPSHARLGTWVQAWPELPRSDGVDTAALTEGPCRRTVMAHPAVLALLASDASRDSVDHPRKPERLPSDLAPHALASTPDVNLADDSSFAQCSSWSVAELDRNIGKCLVEIVRGLEAERAIVVKLTSGELAVIDARDADGEALPDARKRLSDAVIEAVQRGLPWRAPGPDNRGAVAVVPWTVPVGGLDVVGAVVLQNRFIGDAFGDATQMYALTSELRVLLRLRLLESAIEEARSKAQAAVHEVRAVEVRTTEEIRNLRRELESTREQLGPVREYPEIVFASAAMKKMLRQVDRVIATDLPVHVHGESGTGKELVARAIHQLGQRVRGPFVPQNCTAIPPTLFESELFGHERGAFTGAMRSSEGLFRRAHGGTLFLDEIGDLPLELQAKLLRVLETGEVRPVGAVRSISVDVRIVSATHRDLTELIKKGTFREDLYYRLNVIRIDVPALRDRPEDIAVLIQHFLARRGSDVRIEEAAMRAMVRFGWPGNVRQLENEIARASLLADRGVITLADLSPELSASPRAAARPGATVAGPGPTLASLGLSSGSLKDRVDRLEALALEDALRVAQGNKSEVARVLGLSRAGLNLKLKRLGLWDGAGPD